MSIAKWLTSAVGGTFKAGKLFSRGKPKKELSRADKIRRNSGRLAKVMDWTGADNVPMLAAWHKKRADRADRYADAIEKREGRLQYRKERKEAEAEDKQREKLKAEGLSPEEIDKKMEGWRPPSPFGGESFTKKKDTDKNGTFSRNTEKNRETNERVAAQSAAGGGGAGGGVGGDTNEKMAQDIHVIRKLTEEQNKKLDEQKKGLLDKAKEKVFGRGAGGKLSRGKGGVPSIARMKRKAAVGIAKAGRVLGKIPGAMAVAGAAKSIVGIGKSVLMKVPGAGKFGDFAKGASKAIHGLKDGVVGGSKILLSKLPGVGGMLGKGGEKIASAGAKMGAGGLLKTGGKTLLKKLPLIGAIAGLGFGAKRAIAGDWLGGAGEVASGLASTIPGLGTAASLGIDGALAARDMVKKPSPITDVMKPPTQEEIPQLAIRGSAASESKKDSEKFGSNEFFEAALDENRGIFVKFANDPLRSNPMTDLKNSIANPTTPQATPQNADASAPNMGRKPGASYNSTETPAYTESRDSKGNPTRTPGRGDADAVPQRGFRKSRTGTVGTESANDTSTQNIGRTGLQKYDPDEARPTGERKTKPGARVGGKTEPTSPTETSGFNRAPAEKSSQNTEKFNRSTPMKGKPKEIESAMIQTLKKEGVNDPKQMAMIMGQLSHETGGFKMMEEGKYRPETVWKLRSKQLAKQGHTLESVKDQYSKGGSDAMYELMYGGRMGNKEAGDGKKYKGRGAIQLTGKDNYAAFSKDSGIDLVNNPDLAADPEVSAKVAVWYMKKNKLMGKAKSGDIEGLTKGINGGFNGLDDRRNKTAAYESRFAKEGIPDIGPSETVVAKAPDSQKIAKAPTQESKAVAKVSAEAKEAESKKEQPPIVIAQQAPAQQTVKQSAGGTVGGANPMITRNDDSSIRRITDAKMGHSMA